MEQGLVAVRVLAHVFIHPFGDGSGACQSEHPVSVVDIKDPCDRTELVSRIILRVPVEIISETVMTVFFSACNLASQVMHIAAAAVDDISEYALLFHVQGHQLPASVTAVFHKHKWCFCLFVSPDKLPAFFQTVYASDFNSYRDSCFHCLDGSRYVVLP